MKGVRHVRVCAACGRGCVLCAVRCALCAVCLWEVQWLYAVCLREVGAEWARSGGGVRIVRVGEWVKRSVEVHGRWCISLRVAWNVRPTSRIPVFTMHPNLDPTPPCLHIHTHAHAPPSPSTLFLPYSQTAPRGSGRVNAPPLPPFSEMSQTAPPRSSTTH